MKEIKVGEYVRTDKGHILKIEHNKMVQGLKLLHKQYGTIEKHSKNPKNLIQAGDIVLYTIKGLEHSDVAIVKQYTEARTLKTELRIGLYSLEQIDIKKILTKEKFKSECFEVEEK